MSPCGFSIALCQAEPVRVRMLCREIRHVAR